MMTKERRSSGVLKTGDFQGDPPSRQGYSPGKRSHLNLARLQRESIRSAFMLELRWGLGDTFEHVQSLDSSEAYCSGLLSVIELSTLAFTDSGDLRGVAGGDVELGCLCGKAGTSHLCDGSAYSSGCVVNAMAAFTLLKRTCRKMVCNIFCFREYRRHEEEAGGGGMRKRVGGGMRSGRRRRHDEHTTTSFGTSFTPWPVYNSDQIHKYATKAFLQRQLRARSLINAHSLVSWSTALQILAVVSTHTTYQHVHV